MINASTSSATAEKNSDPLSDFSAFWKEVRKLPFASEIPKKVAQEWHASALKSSKTVTWHLRRIGDAQGALVGGSEIGVLVCDHLKERHPFGETPVDLFEAKLLRTPLIETPAMRFGTRYERTCLDALEAQHPDWTVDVEALDAFSQARKEGTFGSKMGGMAYSPDNIYRTSEGRRILVDAKVPFSRKVPDSPPLNYVSQLHQGALVAEHLAMPVDEMVLAYYQMPVTAGESAQLITFEGMTLDPFLAELIPRLVSRFREQVATGRPPLALDDAALQALQSLDRQLLDLRVQRALLDRDEQRLVALLSESIQSLTPSQINVLPLLNKTRSTYALDEASHDAMIQAALDSGVELDRYEKAASGPFPLDEAKVIQAWRAMGQDEQALEALREPAPAPRLELSKLVGENPALAAFIPRKTSFTTPKDLLEERVAQRLKERDQTEPSAGLTSWDLLDVSLSDPVSNEPKL